MYTHHSNATSVKHIMTMLLYNHNGFLTLIKDYWLSVLYKRLVGTKVIFVKGSLEHGRQLRVYAHCAKSP